MDVYRINELVKLVKQWQPATVLKYASSLQLDQAARDVDARHQKERIRGNAMTLVGWSDAAYGDSSCLGRSRLGYIIGIISSNLCGPCHIIQWTSRFTRKTVKSI